MLLLASELYIIINVRTYVNTIMMAILTKLGQGMSQCYDEMVGGILLGCLDIFIKGQRFPNNPERSVFLINLRYVVERARIRWSGLGLNEVEWDNIDEETVSNIRPACNITSTM